MVIKSISIPIYMNRLHIVFLTDFKSDREKVNTKFNQELEEDHDVLGLTQQRGRHVFLCINLDKHTRCYKKEEEREIEVLATIVHEVKHIVNFIFISNGIKLDLDNDEPECYLLDWIFKEVLKVYLKYKKDGKTI